MECKWFESSFEKGYMGEFLLNQKEPIHILCLQETKLQPEQEEKVVSFQNTLQTHTHIAIGLVKELLNERDSVELLYGHR